MFAIGLDGLDETSARLDALPAALGAALAAKAAELSAALADRVRNDKLTGGRPECALGRAQGFDRRRGLCGRRWRRRLGRLVRRRQICGDPGIRRQDRQRTRFCRTRRRRSLSYAGGAQRFARKVEHPGSLIPERSYLRSSLEEMRDEIVSSLAEAAAEAWTRA